MDRKTLYERAMDIFASHADSTLNNALEDNENEFALAFLKVVRLEGGTIVPVDEAKLTYVPGKTEAAEAGERPERPERTEIRGYEDDLEYLSELHNTYYITAELPTGWHRNDYGAFIAFEKESGRPMILRRTGRSYRASYADETGQIRITGANEQKLDSTAIFITPVSQMDNLAVRELLKSSMQLQRSDIIWFVLMTLCTSFISMLLPNTVGRLSTSLKTFLAPQRLLTYAFPILCALTVVVLLNVATSSCVRRVAATGKKRFIITLLNRIMRLNSADERKLSDTLSSVVIAALGAVASLLQSTFSCGIYLVQCVILLIGMSHYGNLAGRLIVLFLLYFACIIVIQYLLYRRTDAMQQKSILFNNMRRELTDNIEAIKNNASEERIFYRVAVRFDDYIRYKNGNSRLDQNINFFNTIVSGVGTLLIMFSAVRAGSTDVGITTSLVTIFGLLISYSNMLINHVSNIFTSLSIVEKTNQVFEITPESAETEGQSTHLEGDIALSHVSFSYGDSTVLRDISLTIRKGEYIGICGSSGSGKSTLIRILLGFEKPDSGTVTYNGTDIRHINPRSLRQQFGVVLQNDSVFTGSIRSNIGLSEDADLARVEAAAKAAAIYDDIMAMPMKFETRLSSETELVSGGQKQRIVLARALLNQPSVLILDEATSAMDNLSQRKVKENIQQMGITRIAVAHRLSTVEDCDRIIYLDQGVIAEEGSFAELMRLNGKFARAARRNM